MTRGTLDVGQIRETSYLSLVWHSLTMLIAHSYNSIVKDEPEWKSCEPAHTAWDPLVLNLVSVRIVFSLSVIIKKK